MDKTTAAPPRHINAIKELRGGCVCSTSPNTHTHLPRWKILLLANTSGLKGDRMGGGQAAVSRDPSHGFAGFAQPPPGQDGMGLLWGGLTGPTAAPPCSLARSRVLLMVCTGSSVPAGAGSGGTSGGKMGLGGLWDWGGCACLPHLLPGADGPIAPCSWDRKNNPEPWNKLGPTDQYKVSTG